MPNGNLVVVLRSGRNALPINNGSVTVTDQSGATVFYEFLNAASGGLSRTVTLETPPKRTSTFFFIKYQLQIKYFYTAK